MLLLESFLVFLIVMMNLSFLSSGSFTLLPFLFLGIHLSILYLLFHYLVFHFVVSKERADS